MNDTPMCTWHCDRPATHIVDGDPACRSCAGPAIAEDRDYPHLNTTVVRL